MARQKEGDNSDNSAPRNFCQEPSDNFLMVLDENMGDPRLAISVHTERESKKRDGTWTPAWDARDSR